MNRDKIGTQTCYIHQCTHKGMLMYIACLCPNLVSVHFYTIPILHFKFFYLLVHIYMYCIGTSVNISITRITRADNICFCYVAISDDISTHADFQVDGYNSC